MSDAFTGCKLAYLFNGQLLVYKRDDFPYIPFPNLWDFPGGGTSIWLTLRPIHY